MKVGTKSLLFGAHCFFIHPWFVALAWWKLYGFPWDPRLWVAFFVHDIGYFGKPNIDGPEGELHPYRGAFIMGALFGRRWFEFTLNHSRFLAKKNGQDFSRLCVADKYSFVLTPSWLYLPMAVWSGEINEYMYFGADGKYTDYWDVLPDDRKEWHQGVKEYLTNWVAEHRYQAYLDHVKVMKAFRDKQNVEAYIKFLHAGYGSGIRPLSYEQFRAQPTNPANEN